MVEFDLELYIAVAVILFLIFIVILVGCCVLKHNPRLPRTGLASRRRFIESRSQNPSEPRYVVTKFGQIDGGEDTYDHLRTPRINTALMTVNANIYGHLTFGNEEEYDVMGFAGNITQNFDVTYSRPSRPSYENSIL